MSIPDPMEIPPYTPSFKPVPQVTPFTYRDGVTMLDKLDGMSKYLNRVIVPFINTGNQNLADAVEADMQALIDQVNAAIQEVLDASVVVQDAVVAGIFQNSASATRIVTDALYGAKSAVDALVTLTTTGRLSDTTLRATFGLKSDVDSLLALVNGSGRLSSATLDARFDAKADDGDIPAAISAYDTATVQPLADTINTGRLSQTALDTRYVKNKPQPHAVFIGSSNSTAGTWTETFCTAMGYVNHNYSVGGGGFTASSSGAFLAQINAAIADTSYDHSLVNFVFICDMGNDIRATNSISANAPAVFSAARTAYPKARIILLPAVWGNADDNNISGRVVSISQRVQEARNAAMPFDVEMVEWSWTWLADATTWMLPGEVHANANGYTRIAQFMQKYMNGESTRYDYGFKLIPPAAPVDPSTAYWRVAREGNIVTLENQFTLPSGVGVDTTLGQLEYGTWPIDTMDIGVVGISSRALNTITIFNTGLIRSFSALAADTYKVAAVYRAF